MARRREGSTEACRVSVFFLCHLHYASGQREHIKNPTSTKATPTPTLPQVSLMGKTPRGSPKISFTYIMAALDYVHPDTALGRQHSASPTGTTDPGISHRHRIQFMAMTNQEVTWKWGCHIRGDREAYSNECNSLSIGAENITGFMNAWFLVPKWRHWCLVSTEPQATE